MITWSRVWCSALWANLAFPSCEIENFLWDTILKKAKDCLTPRLKDFHVQFLHRAFHYNQKIATYRPDRSPLCTFCKNAPETYLHIFWDCIYVTPLWTALQTICYDNVDMEDFSQFKCLLSNFQHTLVNQLGIVLKNYVHVCRWTDQWPTVFGLVKIINKLRNVHFKKCQRCQNAPLYYKIWESLAYDIAMNEIIQYWDPETDVE